MAANTTWKYMRVAVGKCHGTSVCACALAWDCRAVWLTVGHGVPIIAEKIPDF